MMQNCRVEVTEFLGITIGIHTIVYVCTKPGRPRAGLAAR